MNSSARATAVSLGVIATATLHVLVFTVAIWSDLTLPARSPKPPDAMGAGANVGKPDAELGERRMLSQLTPVLILEDLSVAQTPRLEKPVAPSALLVAGPDSIPLPPIHVDGDSDPIAATNAEVIARTKMAGIYESQIRARIQRAWSPESGSGVSCRVRIHQRSDGSISEVELQLAKCEGTQSWQQSVVNAVFAASPLPAPPHPSVFVNSFELDLQASSHL